MAALAGVVIAGVLFRKLGAPLVWYDEVAPILLAWLTYYAACLAALNRAHIGFSKLVDALPARARMAVTALREMCVIGFFALAAWAGWRVLQVLEGEALVSLEWFPAAAARSVIPVSAVVFILAEGVAYVEWLAKQEERDA
ncbi:MAG: TRAP transporter small permease subunit [Bryobacterales bacterium]|nr:TRAP transporter small permease subunit [Bryobacterales bacterium]